MACKKYKTNYKKPKYKKPDLTKSDLTKSDYNWNWKWDEAEKPIKEGISKAKQSSVKTKNLVDEVK